LIASLAIASRRTRRSTFTSTTSGTNPSSVLKKNITKILAFDPVCESEVSHVLKKAVLRHFVRMLYRLVDGRQVVFLKRSLQFCNCLFFLCGQGCVSGARRSLKQAVHCCLLCMLYGLVDGRQVVFVKHSLQFCNCLFFLCGQGGSGDAHMRLALHKASCCDERPVYFNQGARRTVRTVLTYICRHTNTDDDEQWHENAWDRHD